MRKQILPRHPELDEAIFVVGDDHRLSFLQPPATQIGGGTRPIHLNNFKMMKQLLEMILSSVTYLQQMDAVIRCET